MNRISTQTKPSTAPAKSNGAATGVTREKLIDLLNEDLAREYQAVIAYIAYSQVLKGAEYMNVAGELARSIVQRLRFGFQVRLRLRRFELSGARLRRQRLHRPRSW